MYTLIHHFYNFICSNIPAAPAYGVDISHLIQYSRACGFYLDLLGFAGCCLEGSYWTKGFEKLSRSRHFARLTVPINVNQYVISVSDDHTNVLFVIITISSFLPLSWLITRCLTRVTRRMSLVEQELFTLSGSLEYTSGF